MNLETVYEKPIRITVREEWWPEEIRDMCIRNNWYTRGTCADYEAMFDMVNTLAPTPANMLRVAQDISNHSERTDVENVLYVIANYIVRRFYKM